MNAPVLLEFLISLLIMVGPIVAIVWLIAGADDTPLDGVFDGR